MTDPALTAALDDLVALVRDGRPVLVALDFDGAQAPLQDDPDASRALPKAVDALAHLAAVPHLSLALVSGRALADLADKAEVPAGTVLVGSHGAERGVVGPDGVDRRPLDLDDDTAARHRAATHRRACRNLRSSQ